MFIYKLIISFLFKFLFSNKIFTLFVHKYFEYIELCVYMY